MTLYHYGLCLCFRHVTDVPTQAAPVVLELCVPAPSHGLHESRGVPARCRRLLLPLALRPPQGMALPLLLPGTHIRPPGETVISFGHSKTQPRFDAMMADDYIRWMDGWMDGWMDI